MNRWQLTDEIITKFIPILQEYLNKIENITAEQFMQMETKDLDIDFSDTGINPTQLCDLMEELGYKETKTEDNGWELDFWIHLKRKEGKHFESGCENLVISGCGMTFELKIGIDETE